MCFADGQKIAKKLSIQISKETKNIKSLLPIYNSCKSTLEYGKLLSIPEALDPSTYSTILSTPHFSESKQQLIEAFLMMKRSTEEIIMLRTEMKNTAHHYKKKQLIIIQVIDSMATKCDS